jgi:hypothetical protein
MNFRAPGRSFPFVFIQDFDKTPPRVKGELP